MVVNVGLFIFSIQHSGRSPPVKALLLAATGLTIGVASALGLTRLVEAQLFGVRPTDIVTMLLATLAIAAVAMLAGYLPARRATAIDPMQALRFE